MQDILIVDDLESIHEMLEAVVQPIGYSTAFATNGKVALEKFRERRYRIVLADICMEPMDGLELLKELKAIDPEVIVIMMSGYASKENAMASLELGAFDYLTKPFKVDQLIGAVNRAAAALRERQEARGEDGEDPASALVGNSPGIQKLKQEIAKLAAARAPVLIQGESGTQKGLVASALAHSGEANESAPFARIDCAAASAEELKSKLFGEDGKGGSVLAEVQGGALFLESIEALDRAQQAQLDALLRSDALETRLLCSTSQNLEALVDRNAFDEALFYRLSTMPLRLPSLRERPEDVKAIAKSILEKLSGGEAAIEDQAVAALQRYPWPGNVAELKETLKAALEFAGEEKTVRAGHLPEKLREGGGWPSLEEHLAEQSRLYRSQVLRACQGDKARAAEILGCDVAALEEV